MRERPVRVKIQPELGRLDRHLAPEATLGDGVEHGHVVVGHRVRLVEVGQVLAQPGVHRADARRLERSRRVQRRLEGLARHEPADRPLHEPEPRQVLLQPRVSRGPQEEPTHQGRLRTMPPSTGTMAPVMYDAAGLSRNAPRRPSSTGSPYRPSGMRPMTACRTSSTLWPVRAAVASSTSTMRAVVNRPGARPLIRSGRDLGGERLEQAGEPRPQRVRRREAGDRLARRRRQDHEDRGSVARPQVGQRGTDQAESAVQRVVDGGLPARVVELAERSRRWPARVDQQQVEATERLDRAVDGRARSVRGRQVGPDGKRPVDPAGGVVQLGRRPSDQCDPRTLAGERSADGETEPARPPADQRPSALQPKVHATLLLAADGTRPPDRARAGTGEGD